MSHTPGPWIDAGQGTILDPATNLQIAECFENWAGNALLIAAAPDLLEALKLAAKILDINNPEDLAFESEWAGKIRAAIAKAEGK